MNAYIFMTNAITGMGGGQMYVNNKVRFMQEKGWKCYVISSFPGEIVIPGLKEYEKYIDMELISPFAYSSKQRQRKLDYLERVLNLDAKAEVIIESGIAYMAYWGELLAQRINARHFAFLLDERNDLLVSKEYLPFFEFKFKRRELAGIAKNSLKMLFRNRVCITESNNCYLPAFCQNVVEDCKCSFFNEVRQESIVLCCIGRLEKPYVQSATKAFKEVIQRHADRDFDIILIGDTVNDSIKSIIKNEYQFLDNAKLIMPGNVFPLPKELFGEIDIVVASAGCAGVAYREGITTISVDGRDLQAIGVLGYTTQKALYRDNEPEQDIGDLIERILFHNYLEGKQFIPKDDVDLNVLEKHIDFLSEMEKEIKYFDLTQLTLSKKDMIKRVICGLLGIKGYMRLKKVGARIKK